MHFGPRHWDGNNELLLDKLNTYSADVVINTGDNTTDSLESEFKQAGKFLGSLKCRHVVSIPGNHDKRSMRSQDFFRKYIDQSKIVRPSNPDNCQKKGIHLDEYTTGIEENLTDINCVREIKVDGQCLLIVSLDTSESLQDNGTVDEEMLRSVSHEIEQKSWDNIILLNHHSIVDTDSDPLFNSGQVIEFVRKHKIEHVFCGHTHKLALTRSTDLLHKHTFTHYKNGSLTSQNTPNDTNMFLFYENFASPEMKIYLIRIFRNGDSLSFEEEIVSIA